MRFSGVCQWSVLTWSVKVASTISLHISPRVLSHLILVRRSIHSPLSGSLIFVCQSGPKLYIAMGAKGVTNGTTKLHLDVTCAINIMMWSEDTTSQRPGAEWQIFSADSVENLRNFLREEFSLSADEDPIHQQHYYLSHAMLTRLRERHGVSPWTIYQYYGDVVFIPAGCHHQVSFLVVYSHRTRSINASRFEI